MARPCTICNHKRNDYINEAILSGLSLGKIAKQFGVGKASVDRHKRNCLTKAVTTVIKLTPKQIQKDVEQSITGQEAWKKLEDMMRDLKDLQKDAKKQKNTQGAIAAIREQSKIYEIIMKMMIAAKEAEDPYEKKYNDLTQELHQLCGIISSALVGFPKMRDKLLNEINRITA